MSTRTKSKLLALVTGGFLLQLGVQNGCTEYAVYTAAATFDFCAVVNCTGGTYFNFCEPIVLFTDCPTTGTTP